ncbi:hypothetical protein [Sphingomonas sp. R3G8C]|uniref:hypothetical protein n=1 Tax=Novosphingobium rhizosphaerae TaxID=1551649 RepID=UPI0015CDE489
MLRQAVRATTYDDQIIDHLHAPDFFGSRRSGLGEQFGYSAEQIGRQTDGSDLKDRRIPI